MLGVSFIAFLTAGVTSTVVERARAGAEQLNRDQQEQNTRQIVDALTETRATIVALERRLDAIESKLPG